MSERPRKLILLRHGQTEWNASDRMQGQLDTDLSALGRTQAKEAARELATREPLLIVSSDLRRALDTATELGNHAGLEVAIDPRLRETHLGEWQGLDHRQVDSAAPGARAAWRRDARMAPPGGENRVQVAARGVPVITELLDRPDWQDRPVVLVAHGGLIAAVTAALLGLPVESWPAFGGLGNCSWVQLSAYPTATGNPFWRLDVWNASARVASDVL